VSVVITGATGHLGRIVVESLLARGLPAGEIVAAGRKTDRIADLAERGVQVRHLDFDRPETLGPVFAGASKLLLVSASDVGQRIPEHRNAIDAARAAGVPLVVYTSAPKATTTDMKLAQEHKATEEMLQASDLPTVILRNSWYFEVYTGQFPTYLENGVILGAAGDGRISAAARADYAEAAAAVLTTEGHQGKVYELGGDTGFTLTELAAELTAQTGTKVEYRDLPVAEFEQMLAGFGLAAPMPEIFADVDRAIGEGGLYVTTGDLGRLIGRPTTTLAQAVRAAVGGV
jgi:NAD(P)H dehydrogenase (quinone)